MVETSENARTQQPATRNPYAGAREPLPKALTRAGFRQEFVTLDGVMLNYVHGPPAGQPLVLVPGQMSIWSSYDKVMPELARRFTVYALDVRGHGNSEWTPGEYSWDSVGSDLARFIRQVVRRPAVIAGNSSGGILGLWCAANVPDQVSALVLEDPPIFSVELPRFRDRDRWVYQSLAHIVNVLDDPERDQPRYADVLRQEFPISEKRALRVPAAVTRVIDWLAKQHQRRHPGHPPGLGRWAPRSLHEAVRAAAMFDPDFARSFIDGRVYGDFSHEAALREVTCPVLLLHANWKRYQNYGLVGAMDDDDARRVQELVPQTHYRRLDARHVIHYHKPKAYLTEVNSFADRVGL